MPAGTPHAIVRPDAGTALRGPVGGPLTLKLRSGATASAFTALEHEIAPGEGPPLHTHADADETWRVLAGTLRARVEEDVFDAPEGSWVFVPRGARHCFRNVGTGPARLLVLFTPGAMEGFFEDFAQVERADVSPETFRSIGSRYAMDVVGPPLAVSHPDQ